MSYQKLIELRANKSDEEVLELVIANLEELSEVEDEMFEDGIEDGDIKEVGMGWFADSH